MSALCPASGSRINACCGVASGIYVDRNKTLCQSDAAADALGVVCQPDDKAGVNQRIIEKGPVSTGFGDIQ
jgi:hypothetical protein